MKTKDILEWVRTASPDDVRVVFRACGDRIHELDHADERKAGGGTRQAGYRPVDEK